VAWPRYKVYLSAACGPHLRPVSSKWLRLLLTKAASVASDSLWAGVELVQSRRSSCFLALALVVTKTKPDAFETATTAHSITQSVETGSLGSHPLHDCQR